MAEGLLAKHFAKRIFTRSCGVRPDAEMDPFAVAVMDEAGVDISAHRPQGFDDLEELSFDLIVTLTPEAHHRALELTRTMAIDVEYWPTFDPSPAQGSREQVLGEYRSTRDALEARILARFAED